MNDIETLYERIEEEFDELISDAQKKLIETDTSYKKIYNMNKNLRKKYPSLLKIYESDNPGTLNKKEIDALITMLSNELKLKYIEHKKMFMLGSKEAYYYFKNVDMLKEEDAKK